MGGSGLFGAPVADRLPVLIMYQSEKHGGMLKHEGSGSSCRVAACVRVRIKRLASLEESGPNFAMAHCRIYVHQPLHAGQNCELNAEQTHYLRQVMRLAPGQVMILFNGEGGEFTAEIIELHKQRAVCLVQAYADVNRELPLSVHVVQAANRSEKIETVLQKATELGAAGFQVVSSERSQFKLDASKRDKRLERWQKIVLEAAEQSERTAVPDVLWHDHLKDMVVHGRGFALHPVGAVDWGAVRGELSGLEAVTLAIGPEGGWSERDLQLLSGMGFESLKFGERVMRTETAAPALLAAIQAVL